MPGLVQKIPSWSTLDHFLLYLEMGGHSTGALSFQIETNGLDLQVSCTNPISGECSLRWMALLFRMARRLYHVKSRFKQWSKDEFADIQLNGKHVCRFSPTLVTEVEMTLHC